MKTHFAKVLFGLFALFTSGCVAVVTGDGQKRTETRDVAPFDQIEVGHGFWAEATLGSPASVTVEADSNMLAFIETRVIGGVLNLDGADGALLMPRVPVKITVVSPTLLGAKASGGSTLSAVASPSVVFRAEASGGSTLTVTGLDAETMSAESSGMSHLKLQGRVQRAALDASGASSLDSRDLEAESVELDGSGGSWGKVRASVAITGELSGASHFTVLGAPRVMTLETSGGSSVEQGE
jgi:hypothetical protein